MWHSEVEVLKNKHHETKITEQKKIQLWRFSLIQSLHSSSSEWNVWFHSLWYRRTQPELSAVRVLQVLCCHTESPPVDREIRARRHPSLPPVSSSTNIQWTFHPLPLNLHANITAIQYSMKYAVSWLHKKLMYAYQTHTSEGSIWSGIQSIKICQVKIWGCASGRINIYGLPCCLRVSYMSTTMIHGIYRRFMYYTWPISHWSRVTVSLVAISSITYILTSRQIPASTPWSFTADPGLTSTQHFSHCSNVHGASASVSKGLLICFHVGVRLV